MSGSRRFQSLVSHVMLPVFTAFVANPENVKVVETPRPKAPIQQVAKREAPPPAPARVAASHTQQPPQPEYARGALAEHLEQLREQLIEPQTAERAGAVRAQVETLHQKIEELDAHETAEFAAVEQQLVQQRLPAELMQRHSQAVAGFRSQIGALHGALDEAANARTQKDRRAKLTAVSDLLAQNEHRLPRTIDPQALRHRIVKPQLRAPYMSPSEFLTEDEKAEPQVYGVAVTSSALLLAANTPPGDADLESSDEVQLTQQIRDLAEELDHEPVKIFNWVHDNIRYLPTYGSVQGADLTLTMRQGNAFDTTSLLIALLRVSGIPSRYVQGTIEVPIEAVNNWLGGVPNADAAQTLLGQGGVPTVALIQSGRITHLRVEHVWAEAFVDYEPSRGAVQRQGDTWISMDASFKQHQLKPALDLRTAVPGVDFGQLARDVAEITEQSAAGAASRLYPGYMTKKLEELLSLVQQQLQAANPNLDVGDVLGEALIQGRGLSTLSAGLPNRVLARGPARTSLPSNLRHAVTLKLYSSSLDRAVDLPSLSYTTSLPLLRGRRLSVTYAPASDADAQLIQRYVDANASSFPAYLVRVVPRIEIDGATVAQGSVTSMGEDHVWGLALSGPSEQGGVDFYNVTSGDYMVFGIDGNGITDALTKQRMADVPSNTVQENLHQVAIHYWMEHDLLDRFTASARGVFQQRVPSAGLFSFPLGVTYLFGLPRTGSYSVESMDVKRVLSAVWAATDQQRFDYMSQSGLQGSYLESSVFDQLFNRFQGTSKSTSQILVDAADKEIPIYAIDSTNVAIALPKVQIAADSRADIANAVASGKRVLVPERSPGDVSGYVIQDVTTGAATYMIEGGLSGGRGEKCQPSPKPITQVVLDIVIALVIAAIIVGIAALVTAASGGTLGWAAASLLMIVGTGVFFTSGDAYAGVRAACCIVKPVPHKGGDPIHDFCADHIGPNDNPGMDAQVDATAFDAVTGNAVLWEVKTHNYANCRNVFCQTKLWPVWVVQMKAQIAKEAAIAFKCSYGYTLGVGDPKLAADLAFSPTVIRPDICLQPTAP